MKIPRNTFPLVLPLLGLAIVVFAARDQDEAKSTSQELARADNRPAPVAGANVAENSESARHNNKPGFWLGVACDEISPMWCAHLRIENGLAIRDIAGESPAQKSGLQINDLILQINGQVVGSVEDLNRLVQGTQGAPASVEIMREGKNLTLSLLPEIRPPCDEIESIVVAVNANDELDPKVCEELQKAINSKSAAKQRQLLIFRPVVELADEDSSTEKSPNTRNTPNGSPLHLELKSMVRDAVLFDLVELDEDQHISGCCLKLMQVINQQIESHAGDIRQCRSEIASMDAVGGGGDPPAIEAEAAQRENLESQIRLHEVKREVLMEIRERLKSRIEKVPESSEPGSDPDNSLRINPDQCIWS